MGSQVHEWSGSTGELGGSLVGCLSSIRIDYVVFVVHLTGEEIEEGLLLISDSSLSFDSLSHSSLLLRVLCHPEESVEQTESSNDKHYEEVHDFERNVSLLFEIIPLILDISELGFIALFSSKFGLLLIEFSDPVTRVLDIFLYFLSIFFFIESISVDILVSYHDLLAVLGALSRRGMSSIRVHFPLQDWATLGIDIVRVKTDLFVNGIKMKCDIRELT